MFCDFSRARTLSRTRSTCNFEAKAPILTPSIEGSPIFVFSSLLLMALCTSSIKFSGTIILRTAVHFCPAFMVISFTHSLTNRLNSSVSGVAYIPRMDAFNESASRLKATLLSVICGSPFNILPVAALPVKVTVSLAST